MEKLINKLFILSCCLLIYFTYYSNDYMVVRIITVVALSALGSYFDSRLYKIAILTAFAILIFVMPDIIYFTPLICYDAFYEKYAPYSLILLLPISVCFSLFTYTEFFFILMLLAMSFIIKYYAVRLDDIPLLYKKLTDDTRELSLSLEQKNRELLDKQDYEVKLARLSERNRIARELHDSVGHIMSSSILQVGALITTVSDENLKRSLSDLVNTLSVGMGDIRNSVHKLYEESIDLYAQLYSLTKQFTFCRLSFDYDAGDNIPPKIKYAVIFIVKESLTNIAKHSNATNASITFREMPAFYQLVIYDNGSKKESGSGLGMGLNNIRSRVESLNGHINIDNSKGYRIFVSVPRKSGQKTSDTYMKSMDKNA